jgi:hypothetical protein
MYTTPGVTERKQEVAGGLWNSEATLWRGGRSQRKVSRLGGSAELHEVVVGLMGDIGGCRLEVIRLSK